MSDTTKRKKPNMIHIGIGILTVLLVVFIVILMQLVSNIQGTARVVNYAGLIRGETQRIIKLENSGQREDEMIKEVQSFIEGLRHGNDQLKLVRLKDDDFQDKMKELDEYFISLHKEIYRVRTVGYEHTDIISKSERFFKICDEATGLAEVYAQRKATSLATLEKFITADIVVLMLLIGYEFIKAIRFAAMNRILQHKAYLDNATGLPNKNKCEEILGELNPPEDIIVCSFDLNNLRRINDSMGHDAGDAYIYRFAVCLRSSIPSEHFVGRLGGDEFIAVLQGLDKQAVRKLFEDLRKDIAAESKEHREIPLSYAAGFAMASDYPGKTMSEIPTVYAITLLQDTSQRHKQEELEHARLQAAFDEMRTASQAKTDFLSRMSHDIRTPLNGIIGLLNINEKHFDDQKLVLENHKKMETAAKHLLSLINDVLQMSKIEEGQITLAHQEITVKKLMREVETMIRERVLEAGIRWNYEEDNIDDRYSYVYASPLHLRQILLNIYGNCIKYNHPGGTISTKMEQMDVHDKICTYRWTIKDTGIGISKDYIDHIFEPFSQEKTDARSVYQGTGLGMSIVKGLVEQMHGEIKVTSEKGMGSTFVITIPFEIAQKKEQPVAEKIVEQADIRGLNLLVAEDNQLNAEIIQTLLTDDGANVTVVEDGQQAVDQFKNAPQGTFDAILMDIMMPVMDGLTATKEIRSVKRDDAAQIPIIAMTANAFEEDAKKCFAAGMNAHLAKPFQIDKVEKTLVQCIHKSI